MSDQAAYDLIESNRKLIQAMGMHWENEAKKQKGESLAYTEHDFSNLAYHN
jgi:hypothetical protein